MEVKDDQGTVREIQICSSLRSTEPRGQGGTRRDQSRLAASGVCHFVASQYTPPSLT
jgi:hypothetical protein